MSKKQLQALPLAKQVFPLPWAGLLIKQLEWTISDEGDWPLTARTSSPDHIQKIGEELLASAEINLEFTGLDLSRSTFRVDAPWIPATDPDDDHTPPDKRPGGYRDIFEKGAPLQIAAAAFDYFSSLTEQSPSARRQFKNCVVEQGVYLWFIIDDDPMPRVRIALPEPVAEAMGYATVKTPYFEDILRGECVQ